MKTKKVVRMPLRRTPQRTRPPASTLRARAAVADPDEEDYGAEDEPNMRFSHALGVVLALHVIAVGGIFAFNSLKPGVDAKSSKPVAAAESKPATTPAPEPARSEAKDDAWPGRTHTVKAGDTLTHIASQYGCTIESIEKLNEITSYSMIRVGQMLKIPGDAAPARTVAATTKKSESTASEAATKQAFLATKTGESAGTIKSVSSKSVDSLPASATVDVPTTKPVISSVSPQPAASPAATSSTPPTTGGVYVVVKGDNPYNIAKKFHVSYKGLLASNNITDPTKIQIGQKLKIPQE